MKDPAHLKMIRDRGSTTKRLLKKYCLAGLVAFAVFLLIHYWNDIAGFVKLLIGGFVPLMIGAVIAYLINILVQVFERHLPKHLSKPKLRRGISMTLALISLIGGIVLIGILVIPQFTACIRTLIQKAPLAVKRLMSYPAIAELIPEDFWKTLNTMDWSSVVNSVLNMLQNGLSTKLTSGLSHGADALSSAMSGIVDVVLGIVFGFYILIEKDNLKRQFGKLSDTFLPQNRSEQLKSTLGLFNTNFHKYVTGQCIEAIILGALCTLGMLILKLPYAAMIGVLVGVTALIPVAGCYIGAGVGAFMILSVSPTKSLILIVFLMILQQIENNLIYPKVVGDSVGLSGLWVLAAITIGGGVFGVPGMMVAVPIAATVYQMLREKVTKEKPAATSQELSEAGEQT